jgi:membrane protein
VSPEADEPAVLPPLPPGPTARTLDPISGRDLDPLDEDPPIIAWAVALSLPAAWTWRWWERFRDGRGTLSAKGISFYSFFGLLSGLALAFSIAARLPQYEQLLIDVLNQALPGLVGPEGIDPEVLQSVGSTVGIIGGAVLLYSAVSIVRALDDGVRLIYGVQYEPRNFAVKNARFLGYLLLLAPLVAASYVGSTATAGLFRPLLASVGVTGDVADVVVITAGIAVSIALNTLVINTVISRLGGVQPLKWRWRGSLLGGTALEVIQLGTTYFVAFTITNPRYLSFGAPVAMLLLFFAMAVVVLATAAFVATANEDDPVLAARRQQAGDEPRPRRRIGSW